MLTPTDCLNIICFIILTIVVIACIAFVKKNEASVLEAPN